MVDENRVSNNSWPQMAQQTQKVVLKSVLFNKLHHMGTANSECSLEERFLQFVVAYGDNKLRR